MLSRNASKGQRSQRLIPDSSVPPVFISWATPLIACALSTNMNASKKQRCKSYVWVHVHHEASILGSLPSIQTYCKVRHHLFFVPDGMQEYFKLQNTGAAHQPCMHRLQNVSPCTSSQISLTNLSPKSDEYSTSELCQHSGQTFACKIHDKRQQ